MGMVRLLDGREVDAEHEAARHELEARAIAKLHTLAERRAWLENIEHQRGTEAAKRLRHTIMLLWSKKP